MRTVVIKPVLFAAAVLIALKAGTALIGCGSGGGHAGLSREETDLPNTDEWFYDSFDDTGKMAYDAFRKAAEEPFGEEPVPILGEKGESAEISVERLDQVYQGFLYDHPEVFWLSRTYRYRVSSGSGPEEFADAVAAVPLAGSSKELSEWKKEFESAAAQMLQGLDNTENDRHNMKKKQYMTSLLRSITLLTVPFPKKEASATGSHSLTSISWPNAGSDA